MMTEIARRSLAVLLLIFGCSVAAQETASEATSTGTAARPAETATLVLESDSRATREQLHEVLDRLPPQVGKVLKLDPSLWTNENYLGNYPALGAFVKAHPDVAYNSSFYLESIWVPGDPTPETPAIAVWRHTTEVAGALLGFTLAFCVLAWLIRTFVEQRRWSRLQKIHSEVHSKLLDRFASNEDLLRYMQTSPGRRFLESAPIPVQASENRPVQAPVDRILWSVQGGLVAIAAGIGLKLVSWSVPTDAAVGVGAMGALVVAVGVGLVVSAGAAYAISRRLGLWESRTASPQDAASE